MTNFEQSPVGDEILNALAFPTVCAHSLQRSLVEDGFTMGDTVYLPNMSGDIDDATIIRIASRWLGIGEYINPEHQTVAPYVAELQDGSLAMLGIALWSRRVQR